MPARQKYGVVILPSMTTPSASTSRISAGRSAADDGGSRARAASYGSRAVVLWLVCGVARVRRGETKMRHAGASARRGSADGNRDASSSSGVGVLVAARRPEEERRIRSFFGGVGGGAEGAQGG